MLGMTGKKEKKNIFWKKKKIAKSKTGGIPGAQGPARVGRVRTRAASVARFGYIHEAEERSKIIFFSDSMQGVIKKNYFFSFSPLFCKPQLLLLIWAASM